MTIGADIIKVEITLPAQETIKAKITKVEITLPPEVTISAKIQKVEIDLPKEEIISAKITKVEIDLPKEEIISAEISKMEITLPKEEIEDEEKTFWNTFLWGPDDIELIAGTLPIDIVGGVGLIKLFKKNPAEIIKDIKGLKPVKQIKVISRLVKTQDGHDVLRELIKGKAITGYTAESAVSAMQRQATDWILKGRGITAIFKPKTILWGLSGILGAITMSYGVAFGTEWFAKEGLWEMYMIPLSDKMRDYRYNPTKEKYELIQKDIKKLEEVLPKAQGLIESVAWLWPPTKKSWLEFASGMEFELDQIKKEMETLLPKELIKMPEEVETYVRDILDGDTIDTSLSIEGKMETLPEYQSTGHARIRILGINAPEKSPKGEIICSDVEIYEVEKSWVDESRNNLRKLNDRKVTLYIDPNNPVDTHGRILAKVVYNDEDMGLEQIKKGLACGYYRETNKYLDQDLYSGETLKAMNNEVGMWAGWKIKVEEQEKGPILFSIDSIPTNAKVFIDGIATHHNTPTDEIENKDVIDLWTEGKHTLIIEKGEMKKEIQINLKRGERYKETIKLTKPEAIPEIIPEAEEEGEEVEEAEAIPQLWVYPDEPIPVNLIPGTWTPDQEWALQECFNKVWILMGGTAVMSEAERIDLFNSFAMYSDEQKTALNLLFQDITYLEIGTRQMSNAEFQDLKIKYHIT